MASAPDARAGRSHAVGMWLAEGARQGGDTARLVREVRAAVEMTPARVVATVLTGLASPWLSGGVV